ncbi:phage portal protein [Pedobacter sp. Leaf170]|uniref:phage portal protein n=1 Tax=Pedobacter sp. Leaf170 TaxID=2876558 RepID=UPI001E5E64DC|nr:phage portal protein [Pedobacter sp. Leaf170]
MEEKETTLEDLITSKEIDKAKGLFSENGKRITAAREQYDKSKHAIMKRVDKVIIKGEGETATRETIKQWKLPITYQKKIVQAAVAFLVGKPIKIVQDSDETTDDVYKTLIDLREEMRMKAKDQKCAEIMFSETECVKLFVPFTDEDKTTTKIKCLLLSASKGDELYSYFDEYGTLKAFARGYETKKSNITVSHFDIYTAESNHACKREGTTAWDVETKPNALKKIPVVIYNQDAPEWADVQELIERREWLTSKRADTNDYSADPVLVLTADALPTLPDKQAVGKVVHLKGQGAKAEYLFPQMSVDMVANEKEDLKELIHYLTDTPDLTQDKMSSLGLTSGKAIEMAFYGSILKAMSKQGYFEEMIDREISILKAYIKNVMKASDISGKFTKNIDALETSIVFGNPLPDDYLDTITLLSTAVGGKAIMSVESAVSKNPLVTDPTEEMNRLKVDNIDETEI